MPLEMPFPYTGTTLESRPEIDPFGFSADNLLSKPFLANGGLAQLNYPDPGIDQNIMNQDLASMGGGEGFAGKAGAISGAASMVESGIAAFDKDPNKTNTSDIVGEAIGGAGKGLATGASIGMAFGPAGVIPGAIIGGAIGAAGEIVGGLKDKKEEKVKENEQLLRQRKLHSAGRTQFAENGAKLEGASHENGGIDVEVEGGERILSIEDDNHMLDLIGKGQFEKAGQKFASIAEKHDTQAPETVNPAARHLLPEDTQSSIQKIGGDAEAMLLESDPLIGDIKVPNYIAKKGMKVPSYQKGGKTIDTFLTELRETTSKAPETKSLDDMVSDALESSREFFEPNTTYVYQTPQGEETATIEQIVEQEVAGALRGSGRKLDPATQQRVDTIEASPLRASILKDISGLKRKSLEEFKTPLEDELTAEQPRDPGKIADFLKTNAIDLALGAVALKGASKDLPQYQIPGEVYEQLGKLKQLSDQPLTEEEMTQMRQKFTGAATQTLSTLGQKGISPRQLLSVAPQLSGQLMAGELALQTSEEALSRQYNQDYSNALDKFVALDRSLFGQEFNQALRTKEAASGLLGQSIQNIQDNIFLEKQYGEGSPYAQYTDALTEQTKESAEFSKGLKESMMALAKQSSYLQGLKQMETQVKGAEESELEGLQSELETK